MQWTYRHTRLACYAGYVTQAIINNLSPLLFIAYQQDFSVSLAQITLLITFNFAIQMAVDLLSAWFVDRIGQRVCVVGAHVLCVLGLTGLSCLPRIMAPYPGLLIATVLSAVGGGLLEVLVSPIIEALPSDRKEQEMSLLHSFYCWGHVGVVLLSTAYFLALPGKWPALPLLWALLPLINAFLFAKAPLCSLQEAQSTMTVGQLIRRPLFWLLFLMMICSGASEQAMSQWASFFAEEGLQLSKTLGDLLGPCLFALLMGSSRFLFSRGRMPLEKGILLSACLCIACYLITVLSPWPLLSLISCAVCGFSVGVMWPGTFSLSSQRLPAGGTAMFALLALGGDIGCCAGPSLVGAVSDGVIARGTALLSRLYAAIPLPQAALKTGFLAALVFPLLLAAGILLLRKNRAGLS